MTGDGLDSGLMNQGDTYATPSTRPGPSPTSARIHPNMKGSVEVAGRVGSGDKEAIRRPPRGQTDPPAGGCNPGQTIVGSLTGESGGGHSGDDGGSLPATGVGFAAAGVCTGS